MIFARLLWQLLDRQRYLKLDPAFIFLVLDTGVTGAINEKFSSIPILTDICVPGIILSMPYRSILFLSFATSKESPKCMQQLSRGLSMIA